MADDAGGSNPINALTASQTVLDCFWNLALPEEAKRLAAAESLVKELVDRQREHAQAAGVGAQQDDAAPLTAEELQQLPKPKRQEAALSRCSPLMVYALRRLIRGLGSGRQGARQGFATALALLLRQQCEQQPAAGGGAGGDGDQQPPLFVDAMDVLALLETCLETGGGSVKQGETRDNLVGRLFGYGALVQSGLLTRGSPGAAAAPAAAVTAPGTGSKAKAGKPGKAAAAAAAVPAVVADIGPCVACVKAVLAVGSSKSFLREAATKTVLELAWALGPAGAARLVEGSAELQSMISVEPKDATPEALLLALCLWPVLSPALAAAAPLPRGCPAPPPSALFPASPQLPGQSHDRWALSGPEAPPAACTDAIFNAQYIQSVLPALLATTSANPHLHSLWCALLPLLLPGARAQGAAAPAGPTTPPTAPAAAATPAMRHVEALWSCVVEQSLLPSPSHERKFLAFKLFQILLPHLGPDHVPVVLSKSFSKVLVNNLSKKDNYLHAAARRCMDALASFAEGGDAAGSVSAADGGVAAAPAAGGSTRLAVAAALQQLGIKLPSAAKQQQQPGGKKVVSAVAVLDAAGVSSYLAHMMQSFLNAGRQDGAGEAAPKGVAAAVQAQQAALSAKARRKAQAAKGEEEDGEEAGEAAGEDAAARAETQRAYAVEQLCTAVRFPAAPAEDVERVTRFLATHALFEVAPGGAEGGAEEKAAATPGKSEKKKKKQRQAVPHEVAAAAAMAAPVSPATRRLCAQRLVALAGWLATAHRTQNKKQQQQQQAAAEPKGAVKQDGDGKAGAESQQQQQQQTVDGPKVLGSALAYVHGLAAAAAQPGAPAALVLPLDGERDVALTLLREVEGALAEAAAAADPAAAAAGDGGRAAAARRGLLQLVRMLQLHALADPEGVEPDLALGLRRVACEGLSAELPDLKAEAAEEEEESEEEEEEEGGKGKEDGKGKAAPWQDVLVDVMLSLLSRPAAALPIAPLREAVEAAWRGLAWSLTETGMRDLVRVVATGPEEAGAAGEVLEEDDDEEVEEDEDEHSEDEEEEEEGEEEEGSGKQTNGEEGKKKGKAAGKEGKGKKEDGDEEEGDEEEGSEGGDGDEEESEEEEEADDAEMFRMDAKMAAYLRATVDARKGAADRRAALANLRLRALSLIEAYAKKVPGSPLLLLALTPMTRALIIARRAAVQHRGGGDLSGRLAAVLTGLCRQVAPPPAAAAPLAMPLDELLGCLRRMQRAACCERERGAAAAAAAAWAALLRAAAAAPDEAPRAAAADAYRSALSHLLTKKGTRLHRSTLEEAAKGAPGAALSALSEVMRACVSARNAHMQHEALQLLASFFAVRRQQPKQRQQQAAAKGEGTAAAAAKGAPEGDSEAPIAAAVMEHRQALGAALVAATAGVGMKKDQHTAALKAAVFVLEGLRRIFNKKRLAEVLGAECINGLAKAVVTVKDLGVLPKVSAQLDRLVATTSLSDLLAKTEPDPALRSKLTKAQAKLQQQQAAAAEKAAQKKAQRAAGQAGVEGGEKGKRERKGKEGKEKAGGKKEGKEGKGKQEKKGKEGGKQKGGEKGEKKRKAEGGQEGAAGAAAKRKDEGEASAAQQRNKGKQGKGQEADEGQQQRKKQKKQEGQEQAGTSEPAEQQPEQQQQQQQKSQKKRKGQEQGTVAEAQQQQEQQQPESDQKSKKAKKQGKRAAADGEGSDAAVAAAVMAPQESGKKAKKQKSSS